MCSNGAIGDGGMVVIGDGGWVRITGTCDGELLKSGNGNAVGVVGVISM